MNDSTAVIRQQMDETRGQLSEKLQSLEHQVSDTVHSTGTAVTATVGAVQETVESVTEAVHDAVRSVSNAFDLQQHLEKHPWIVLGGSVVLGYLACEVLEGAAEKPNCVNPRPDRRSPANKSGVGVHTEPEVPAAAPFRSATHSHIGSQWNQITSAVTTSIIGILQDAASRVVPEAMEYISRSGGLQSLMKTKQKGSSTPNQSVAKKSDETAVSCIEAIVKDGDFAQQI